MLGQVTIGLLAGAKGQDVTRSAQTEGGDVVGAEHAAVSHQHYLFESETAAQLLGHRLQGGDVHCRVREDAVGDGQPLLCDRQPDHDLDTVAAVVAREPYSASSQNPVALE